MYILCVTMLVAVGGVQWHGRQVIVKTVYLHFYEENRAKFSTVVCTSVYNVVVEYEYFWLYICMGCTIVFVCLRARTIVTDQAKQHFLCTFCAFPTIAIEKI